MPTRKVIADSVTLRDNKEKCERRPKLYSLIVKQLISKIII